MMAHYIDNEMVLKCLETLSKHYVLLMYKTRVSEQNNHNWVYRDYVLWFLPKHSMYNALILLKPSKKQNYSYINVASYPIYEDNTIKFIDLDYYEYKSIHHFQTTVSKHCCTEW